LGRNICGVVRATAPWLKPVPPSRRFLSDTRFELRAIEECLSAWEVADAYSVRMLGSDESTKFGNAAITSNVLVQATPGAECKVVILRGVYCSAGGTAEAVAKAIESKCFARLRDHLRGVKAMFEHMFPGEQWTGPDAERVSLGRLAGGGALQSDTCNTAQKTKTLLAAMIAEQARALIGEEEWALMSEAQRAHATRVHK
jgi:hypothetical protein